MKKILFIPVILLSLNLYSQFKTINLQSENLNGNVKSYFAKTYIISENSDDLSQKYAVKTLFNKRGDVQSIENYGNDATIDSKEIHEYKQERLIQTKFINALGKTSKTIDYSYDNDGNLSTQKKYDNQGKLQYETSFIFNQKGLIATQQKLIPSINYTMKQAFKYDAHNNMLERTKTTRIGTTKETFTYSAKALETKKMEYNVLRELFSVIDYTYNDHNDKVSLKKYDVNGTLTYFETYQYIYDATGNWTARTSFEKGVKVSVEKREIEYFQ